MGLLHHADTADVAHVWQHNAALRSCRVQGMQQIYLCVCVPEGVLLGSYQNHRNACNKGCWHACLLLDMCPTDMISYHHSDSHADDVQQSEHWLQFVALMQ